jgi:hypothetical protein
MSPALDLDIRALRGRLTREVLVKAGYEVPEQVPYGDPGLLIPYFYERSPLQTEDFCLIPHHSDYDDWRWKFPGFNVLDIRTPTYESLQPLISEITKYKVVFTSSLHITILAEAFGIPVQPVAPKLAFKLDDFYSGVGKFVEYVPVLSRESDWLSLYEAAIRNWRPIRWDPRPWLAAAPFPLAAGDTDHLTRHYGALARRTQPFGSFCGPDNGLIGGSLPASLRGYYSHLRTFSRPQNGVIRQNPWNVLRVFHPEDWIPAGVEPAGIIDTAGTKMTVNASKTVTYAATPFFRIEEGREFVFRVPIEKIGGHSELVVQSEDLVTRASCFVRQDDQPGVRELSIVPIPGESVRLCIVIYSGQLTLGPVAFACRQNAEIAETGGGMPSYDHGDTSVPLAAHSVPLAPVQAKEYEEP